MELRLSKIIHDETKPAEDSIAMRVVACLMCLVGLIAGFVFGESDVPVVEFSAFQWTVILLCIWITILGSVVSYHYRHNPPQKMFYLVKVGAVIILLNLVRELFEANMVSQQFQCTSALVHALAAASVVSSFELRTNGDLLGYGVFGLLLLVLAAGSGKGILFGVFIFVYICLGTMLLLQHTRSQARAQTPTSQTLIKGQNLKASWHHSIMGALTVVAVLSLAIFSTVPRVDSQADDIAAHVRSIATGLLYEAKKQNGTVENDPHVKSLPTNEGEIQRKRRKEAARIQAERKELDQKNERGTTGNSINNKNDRKQAPPEPAAMASKNHGTRNTSDGERKPNNGTPEQKTSGPEEKNSVPPLGDKNASANAKPDSHAHNVPNKSTAKSEAGGTAAGKNKSADAGKSLAKENESSSAKALGKEPSGSKAPGKGQERKNKQKDGTGNNKNSRHQIAAAGKKASTQSDDETQCGLNDETASGDEVIFSLECNRSIYTKTLVMNLFDGTQWRRDNAQKDWTYSQNQASVVQIDDCPSLLQSAALPVMELAESYEFKQNLGHFLPIGGFPEKIRTTVPKLHVDATGSVFEEKEIRKGDRYSVMAQLPIYSLAEMRVSPESADIDSDIEGAVELPASCDPQLIKLADSITAGGGNRFVQAERIVSYLRSSCDYKPQIEQDTQTSEKGKNIVNDFVLHKAPGDCKTFASGFICLSRAAGIPARLVVGYAPGDPDPVSGATLVKRKHGHAWAEIYMLPYGWIPFDPTPGGMLPARQEEQYYNATRMIREVETYTAQANDSASGLLATVLTVIGKTMYALLGLVVVAIVVVSGKLLIPAVRNKWQAQKRHPATKLRDKVYRRLRRLGVEHTVADSGLDMLNKFNQSKPAPEVAHRFQTFLETYNAVYFGREDRMPELQQTAADFVKSLDVKRRP